jgi:hypothetical protein
MARLEPVRVEPTVPSVTESLDRMVDAAQNVVADEMKLLRVQAITSINTSLRSAGMLAAGALLLGVGWIIALMAVFQVLAPRLGTLETLGVLIAANVLTGLALVLAAGRRTSGSGRG